MNVVDDNLLADVASTLATDITAARIKPSIKIISVRDLISDHTLTIPDYQRPYKWTLKNVNDLLDDILLFKDKPAYRLGTIVFHREELISEEKSEVKNFIDMKGV